MGEKLITGGDTPSPIDQGLQAWPGRVPGCVLAAALVIAPAALNNGTAGSTKLATKLYAAFSAKGPARY
jgi:uncharacterized membrane protein